MSGLQSRHLVTLRIDVAFADLLDVGGGVLGKRRIVPISGGSFEGERLRGAVLPGADWVIARPDGRMAIDVRIGLKTDDGAAIYLTYQGLFSIAPEAAERYGRGEPIAKSEYSLRALMRFEAGAERYTWLNDMLAVGIGTTIPTGAIYEVFEVV
jgi:hypothetical protein